MQRRLAALWWTPRDLTGQRPAGSTRGLVPRTTQTRLGYRARDVVVRAATSPRSPELGVGRRPCGDQGGGGGGGGRLRELRAESVARSNRARTTALCLTKASRLVRWPSSAADCRTRRGRRASTPRVARPPVGIAADRHGLGVGHARMSYQSANHGTVHRGQNVAIGLNGLPDSTGAALSGPARRRGWEVPLAKLGSLVAHTSRSRCPGRNRPHRDEAHGVHRKINTSFDPDG